MKEFSAELLSAVYFLVFYGTILIPAFIIVTYIIGKDKDKRFSPKQIIALAIAIIPFLFFLLK